MSSKSSASARPARPEDCEAVAAIEKGWSTTAGWSAAQLRHEALSADALFFVVEYESRLVAYALARKAVDEAQIVAVGVHPSQIRRGHGRAALQALLKAAKLVGLAKATLEVSSTNAAAQAMYLAEGFRVVGRRPKFYNDGSDAVLMDLPL